jgi:hypothetical protein
MNTLELHEQFHLTFGQPVLKSNELIPESRRKLRLKLALEELTELATAFGCLKYFNSLCTEQIHTTYDEVKDVYNDTEVFDALVDIQVINDGTILECGMKDMFYIGYKETYENNMSKLHDNIDELNESIEHHTNNGLTNLSNKEIDCKYILYRSDGKIIKPLKYVSNDLTHLVENRFN